MPCFLMRPRTCLRWWYGRGMEHSAHLEHLPARPQYTSGKQQVHLSSRMEFVSIPTMPTVYWKLWGVWIRHSQTLDGMRYLDPVWRTRCYLPNCQAGLESVPMDDDLNQSFGSALWNPHTAWDSDLFYEHKPLGRHMKTLTCESNLCLGDSAHTLSPPYTRVWVSSYMDRVVICNIDL